jgi:hypothetical protein
MYKIFYENLGFTEETKIVKTDEINYTSNVNSIISKLEKFCLSEDFKLELEFNKLNKYLHDEESKGPEEKSTKSFRGYDSSSLSTIFFKKIVPTFIEIENIICFPNYYLCLYIDLNDKLKAIAHPGYLNTTCPWYINEYEDDLNNFFSQSNTIKKKYPEIQERYNIDKKYNQNWKYNLNIDIVIDIAKIIKKEYNIEIFSHSLFKFDELDNIYASLFILSIKWRNINKITGQSGTGLGTQVFIPENINEYIVECKNKNKKFIVFYLKHRRINSYTKINMNEDGIIEQKTTYDPMETIGHANNIIFDIENKIIERFEPHGYGIDWFEQTNNKRIDELLAIQFKELLPEWEYKNITTVICIGPQSKEGADAFDGMCLSFSSMYIILRLLYPDVEPEELVKNFTDLPPHKLRNKVLRFNKYMINTVKTEENED